MKTQLNHDLVPGPVDGDLIPREPTLRVYVLDDYGAGYLNADLKGLVRKLYSRS
ncbi:hypothetical protein [Streptomyces sp. NPDC051219]|uniref:hypothetical protein n=1 Tax=Streptomyces sp. NPDC051219 TaxID=3155283 RepID=UPI003431C57F